MTSLSIRLTVPHRALNCKNLSETATAPVSLWNNVHKVKVPVVSLVPLPFKSECSKVWRQHSLCEHFASKPDLQFYLENFMVPIKLLQTYFFVSHNLWWNNKRAFAFLYYLINSVAVHYCALWRSHTFSPSLLETPQWDTTRHHLPPVV